MRRGGWGAWLAIAAAIASATACDQLFGIDERPLLSQTDAGDATTGSDAPGGDDSSMDASTGDTASSDGDATTGDSASGDGTADASGEGATDSPSSDAPACTGPTLYVSTKGKDSNPGCDPGNPKSTIASALAAAGSGDAGVTTIEVCAGTYMANSLTLQSSVSLLGGYGCTVVPWTRTATYGYPTFDPTNLTTLEVTSTSTSGATLTITEPGATGTVDGFTIQGQLTGTISTTAAAIRVTGASAPTISNDHLIGGGTTYSVTTSDPTPASAGLVVDDGATPLVTMDTIEGGSGTTAAGSGTGSVGVYATGANGPLTLTGCTVHGGSGRATGPSGSGSQGMLLNGSAAGIAYTIESSAIQGGTGSTATCASGCRATRGLYLFTGTATLVFTNNAIEGGDLIHNTSGSVTGTDCPHGVESLVSGTVTVTGNRIYGGRCNLSSPANIASFFGLYVGGGATLVATDNMIHMGTSTIAQGGAALGGNSLPAPRIVHNTLIGGPTTGGLAGALWLQGNTTGAVVQNNILAGSGDAPQASGLLLSCPADGGPFALASFENNLVFGATSGLLQWSNCNGNPSYATVDAMTAELNSVQAGTASGNVTVNSSCGTDSGCVTTSNCATQAACLGTVFEGFDSSTNLGYANLFPASLFAGTCPDASAPPSGNGWPLAAPPPCLVARSGLNDSNTVTKDLYGNCRSTAGPTMGAAEYVGACH